ncbi:fimbrial protein [Serratia nevei]|uniref:fimbrial protein n=1 Tax=Serratia TaxID=613 RepID=UPI00313C2D8B
MYLPLVALFGTVAHANTTLTVSGSVIAPASCVINDNKMINVNFGNQVITTRVGTSVFGTDYMQQVIYTMNCKNASRVKMKILGDTAPFNGNILRTEQNDLGVALRIGSTLMAINSAEYIFDYPDKPALQAVPVKRAGGALTGGQFNAGATMVLSFP